MCNMDIHKAFGLIPILYIMKAISVVQITNQYARFQIHTDYNDIYCSGDTIVYDNVPSNLVCTHQCYKKPGCLGFFYNNVTKKCSAVQIVSVPENGCQSLNGTIYYSVQGPACSNYLLSGVEDSQLTESSHFCKAYNCPAMYNVYSDATSARFARLNSTGYFTDAWSAPPGGSTSHYVQVDFKHGKTISGIALQGRDSTTQTWGTHQYVTKFKVLLSKDCFAFNAIANGTGADIIFEGNSDHQTIVIRYLPQMMIARCVRINPVQWFHHNSLRFDVLGC